jgi:beta-fructofuranosidase
MQKRLLHHFEPAKGWMNDPNGLCQFRGRYHAFFQHNPDNLFGGRISWGHAASDDLLHWERLPDALSPDMPYEDYGGREFGGCWSGSAIVKDGRMYLFYTSNSLALGQTQSMAVSSDGIRFDKYPGNPILPEPPHDAKGDFRDPKVMRAGSRYYMVLGAGKDGCGKVLLYVSDDLCRWEYVGVLLEGEEYGEAIECPDLFPFNGKYMLMFSRMNRALRSTLFIYGDFDGRRFAPISFHEPEIGPHFYAPQTFGDDSGRRVMIGWMNNWSRKPKPGAVSFGALTIPRELSMSSDGILRNYPVKEARGLLVRESELVGKTENQVRIAVKPGEQELASAFAKVESIDILPDEGTLEVFVNGGEQSFTYWHI